MRLLRPTLFTSLLFSMLFLIGCSADGLLTADSSADEYLVAPSSTDNPRACWGQASAVFARMGEMGYHASQQEEPRAGLYNLAVELFNQGLIDEASIQALGEFVVAVDPDLSVDACM